MDPFSLLSRVTLFDIETIMRVQTVVFVVGGLIIVAMQMLIMVALIRHSRAHEERDEEVRKWSEEHAQQHEELEAQMRHLRPMVFHSQEHGRDAPRQQ